MTLMSPRSVDRGRGEPLTFARFVPTPENQAALVAIQDLAESLCAGRQHRLTFPLFLHGPAGSGKTHLATALVDHLERLAPPMTVVHLSAIELRPARLAGADNDDETSLLTVARDAEVLILEDLQHLALNMAASLEHVLDERETLHRPTVLTAVTGPGGLTSLPARLTSRLAGGLVVALRPLGPESRLLLLLDKAQRRQLAVSREILAWLAERLAGGGRELEGALSRLDTLLRLHHPLDLATVAKQLSAQLDAGRPTIERIVQRVGRHFQVDLRQLLSRRRYRSTLRPRQVSMYFARRLTSLSLQEIGAFFGGRDHTTVLHACRKVEAMLERDAALASVIRQLQAELT